MAHLKFVRKNVAFSKFKCVTFYILFSKVGETHFWIHPPDRIGLDPLGGHSVLAFSREGLSSFLPSFCCWNECPKQTSSSSFAAAAALSGIDPAGWLVGLAGMKSTPSSDRPYLIQSSRVCVLFSLFYHQHHGFPLKLPYTKLNSQINKHRKKCCFFKKNLNLYWGILVFSPSHTSNLLLLLLLTFSLSLSLSLKHSHERPKGEFQWMEEGACFPYISHVFLFFSCACFRSLRPGKRGEEEKRVFLAGLPCTTGTFWRTRQVSIKEKSSKLKQRSLGLLSRLSFVGNIMQ